MCCSNAAYAFLLNDKVRARVEARGRVEPSEAESAQLAASKNVHAVLVVAFVSLQVTTITEDSSAAAQGLNLFGVSFLAFLLGGLADARRPTAGETATAACKATGEWLAGFVVYACVILAA